MAAVPVTRTWVAGEIVTAPHFNDNIRDVLLFLLAKPIVQVRQATPQSLSNNAWADITFTLEDVDSSGMHSVSTNTNRFTAVYPGWYDIGGIVGIDSNGTGYRGARLGKNGTAIDISHVIVPAHATFAGVASFRPLMFLNVGDYGSFQGLQNSGIALNTVVSSTVQSAFTARWESN